MMPKYRHNLLKELWWNRPWVYIPAVIKFMRDFPLKRKEHLFIWLQNCFYLNWQNCLVEVKDGN